MWKSLLSLTLTLTITTLAIAQDAPPDPGGDEFDWLQFTNGEWLKGEIKDLQDDTLIFESDQLDTFTLDLEDVQALILQESQTVTLRDRTVVQGPVRIEGDEVIVQTEEGERTFSRGELRSLFPGDRSEWNLWSGKFSLGTTVLRGNTDQTTIAGYAKLERRDTLSRLTLQYDGAYAESDDDKIANNHRGLGNYDIYLTDRFFVRPARIELLTDEFQNIEYRITPSAGAGYDIIDTSRWEWTVAGGAGWQFTRFKDPPPGMPEERDSAALLAATRVSWEATSDIDIGFEFDATMPVPETGDYNLRAALIAEIELYSDFDLDVQLIWNRNNSPSPLANGMTPQEDDYRIYVGIGYSF